MMNEPVPSEADLGEKLLETLQQLPFVQAQPPNREARIEEADSGIDADFEVDIAGKPFHLFVQLKKSVYPRDVREVLWFVKHLPEEFRKTPPKIFLLAAESMSPGAKELLRDEGVGYFDSGGSLFIPAPGAYVLIDKPPPKTFSKTVRSLFQGKRSQVIHALLQNANEWFSVKALAELAKASPATTSETLSAL